MHKQLLLFHNAISAYFAGNQQQLEETLKQFNIKLRPLGADKPSWIEEQWEILQPSFQPPTPVPCWNPQLTEDHNRGKCAVTAGWMRILRVLIWSDWISGFDWNTEWPVLWTFKGLFVPIFFPASFFQFNLFAVFTLIFLPNPVLYYKFAAQACVGHWVVLVSSCSLEVD